MNNKYYCILSPLSNLSSIILNMDNKEISPLNDEWSFWYAIRGKEAKDAEHYNGTLRLTQRTSRSWAWCGRCSSSSRTTAT